MRKGLRHVFITGCFTPIDQLVFYSQDKNYSHLTLWQNMHCALYYWKIACGGYKVCSVCIPVVYLVLFHPLFIMMCWCYWKTIFTPVATTPKQVPYFSDY